MSGFDIPPSEFKPRLIGDPTGDGVGAVDEGGGSGLSFKETLNGALSEVRGLQLEYKGKVEALSRGENVEVHDLMIAMGKSEVAFNLMLEIRNKLLEAWQTLSRSVN